MKKTGLVRRISILLLLIYISGVFTACSSKKESKNSAVRVAHFPNITHSQALIGRAEGQFQKAIGEDNKIEWKVFNAGPAEIEAFFAGEVDIGYIGPGPAINGYSRSKGELQIVAGATNAGAILVSRRDLTIRNVKELSGKKVAVPQFGNTQDLSLRNLLKENGLRDAAKGGDVEIRQADNPDIKILLDKGDIDAALVPEPWGSRLIKEVGAKVVLDFNRIWRGGEYSTAVVVVRTAFLEEYPDLVEKFIKAHVELTEYINKNIDTAKQTVNAQIELLTKKPLSKDILDESFKRLTVTYSPEKDSVIGFVDLSVENGFLRQRPEIKNIFNLEILNKVLKEKGLSEVG
ncbi:MAG: aliphatic sulfonate ABC transporter substrate-binding protein [Clostridia bacterium]|nr:aliphatic sulfonate ABC transporter substrate-binding protein [Clostridia bacterium]